MTDTASGIDLVARLHVAIEGLTASHERLTKYLESPTPAPVPVRKTAQGPAVAGSVLVLDLGRPEQGIIWEIRSCRVGGVTPTTAAAGRADLYICAATLSSFTALNQFSMADWSDQAISLPLVGEYGAGVLALAALEHLWVVISGGTTGQVYTAQFSGWQYRVGGRKQAWAL